MIFAFVLRGCWESASQDYCIALMIELVVRIKVEEMRKITFRLDFFFIKKKKRKEDECLFLCYVRCFAWPLKNSSNRMRSGAWP